MVTFNENLDELYLNYDTVSILKNETNNEDIISMFKNELDYSEDLTSCMLKIKKSYLNSVVMRIKIRQKSLSDDDIKKDLLNFNTDLSPILDKLLTNEKFINAHNQFLKTEDKVVKEIQKIEEKIEPKEENINKSIKSIDEFVEEWLDKTNDDSDFVKVSELYDYYTDYCTESEYEKEAKSSFKEYLTKKIGKPVNSGYKGYKFAEEE